MTRVAIYTANAPSPAGSYSQAVTARNLLFISCQTPRNCSGARQSDASFDEQVKLVLDNINEIANEVGLSLKDAVKVSVFLKDPGRARASN
jgi:2-iminobutanoate/2-iminopropanoate deaminase